MLSVVSARLFDLDPKVHKPLPKGNSSSFIPEHTHWIRLGNGRISTTGKADMVKEMERRLGQGYVELFAPTGHGQESAEELTQPSGPILELET